MTDEVLISFPNGQTRTIVLEGERWTVGRSIDNDFGYPEDAGLSRQHLVLEFMDGVWSVRDLGSKNGTFLNSIRLQSKQALSPGDSITASQLSFVFQPQAGKISQVSVVFDER